MTERRERDFHFPPQAEPLPQLLLVAKTVAGLENVAGLMNRHGKQQRNDKFIVKRTIGQVLQGRELSSFYLFF